MEGGKLSLQDDFFWLAVNRFYTYIGEGETSAFIKGSLLVLLLEWLITRRRIARACVQRFGRQ